jgi:hypothetical protein
MTPVLRRLTAAVLLAAGAPWARASDEAGVARKLQNPVSDLASLPFQNNFEFGGGPSGEGFRYVLNVQPVVPVQLSPDWNVIGRVIVPLIHQRDLVNDDRQSGAGDVLASAFFSPRGSSGTTWGAGPAVSLPMATDTLLGTEKWSVGPTVVAVKQDGGLTLGLLANHLWSAGGDGSRAAVNATFLQPVLSFTTKTHTTLGLNTESTYDWTVEQWTVPVNLTVSQLLKAGGSPVQMTLGAKYYAEAPRTAPDWGLRAVVTMIF